MLSWWMLPLSPNVSRSSDRVVTPRNWFRRLIFFSFFEFKMHELSIFENIYIFFFSFSLGWKKVCREHTRRPLHARCWVPMLMVAWVKTVVIGQCMTSDLCGWKIVLNWLSQLVFLFFSFYPYAYSFYTAEILKCSVQGMFLSPLGRWVINPCLVSALFWVSFRDWTSSWSLVAN